MKIDLNTLSEIPLAIDSYGEKTSALLDLWVPIGDLPFAIIQKKLFAGTGEIFTSDRFLKFKSNGGFSKLKNKKEIIYSDITEFASNSGSTRLSWDFIGASGKFNIGLVFYGQVKSLSPRDLFWYEVDDFPPRSKAFYDLISAVVPSTGITSELKTSSLKSRLKNAIEFFEGKRKAEDIKLNLLNVIEPGFFALQHAFSMFLAGTTLATETTRGSYLEIYRSLDDIYVRILRKLMVDYNTTMGNIFNREQEIYEADEKFQKLSLLWYLRQIANLHFASKYLPMNETRAWPMKVLKPRARVYRGSSLAKLEIKLPTPEIYEEAIVHFDKKP